MRDMLARLLDRLRLWWGWDADDRRVRVLDRLELLASVISIGLMVAMFIWVHHQGTTLGKAQVVLNTQQQALTVERRSLDSQHLAQVEACRRLQIVRVEQNASNYHQYHVDRVVLVETEAAIRSPDAPLTARQVAFEHRFVAPLRAAVQQAAWVPRTDCAKAVNLNGVRYRAPSPVRFVDRLPPPDALHVLPGDYQ